MATVSVAAYDGTTDNGNIQLLKRGVVSGDLIASGAQLDDDDTVSIDVEFNDDVLIAILDTGGGSTVSVAAGNNPPSPKAGLGAASLTIPADDLLLYVPEAGRHVQSDGTIDLTVGSGEQVLVWVFRAPAGFLGIPITNVDTIPSAPTD